MTTLAITVVVVLGALLWMAFVFTSFYMAAAGWRAGYDAAAPDEQESRTTIIQPS